MNHTMNSMAIKVRKTRYLLDKTSGIKIPSSLSAKQIEIFVKFYLARGMKEVSKKEYFKAKKEWS